MRQFNYVILAMLWLSLGASAIASEQPILDVSVGWSKPPYVIEQDDSGFEIELVKAIFNQLGYQLKFIYVPFARSPYLLNQGETDLAMTINPRMDIKKQQLSIPYISYHNVAISLKERHLTINVVADLANYSVVAFQNAKVVLGYEYGRAVKQSLFYQELPDQAHQVEMLLKGRTDVVVMDINIFNYLSRAYSNQNQMDKVNVHTLFPVSKYQLGFKNSALKDLFNEKLNIYKGSDAYQQLLKKYEFYQVESHNQP
ncbi:substrate-binding periplasmic protein [Pseudoalteromonas tunicata]|uniref:ABC-type amino acid transport/signal transduction systems periplasmic component/domain-like protein n=1 Tax=Pseudoalteromonas tunicata D2 TaxID=87626 RepID=A4C8D8_9GAMM|nr:transporter substrate-binding domain-containing protein [Pseudoalteromonas tunicata]ATC93358.1 hypothetical protein PTUN_a0584 [Pseudoalteromonas tunicata]AXT32406.1 amino acid ABC transporter substrate-binding protein [Pseudoalteromonas tunicata]EAR28853.1 ABC-type amino acid transport/signal transduction systems periplasmic component/domain-like protein [Pseudoalteromonas tunicata D2]